MAVTIKQIASVSGVSRGTVDRVLHNRPGVNPEVAAHVREIADSLGFTPNRAGKILATRKQPIKIGCFLPGIGNAFFDDVIAGFRRAEEELADFGVSIAIVSVKGYNAREHVEAMDKLAEEGCAAMCVSTVDTPEMREHVDKIIGKGIPVITVNTDLTETGRLCYVGCDYYQAGRTAAGLLNLVLKKERNLLIVTGSLKMKGHNERIQGFSQTLKEKNIPYRLVDTFESLDNDDQAYSEAVGALRRHAEINCVYIAAAGVEGTCKAITELGREKDIIVLSHDEVEATRKLVHGGVIDFTLGQEPGMQGYKAILLMFDYLINNKKIHLENYITDTVIRISENLK